MTVYYVGIGGNDGSAGTSWAARKLTLNGAENIPVAAGDTVYVGPGTYRELLTVDVSGSVGSPITYIGDYSGVNTDGVGGIVRITGSDNDQTGARSNCITAGGVRTYRTFQGFLLDTTSTAAIITVYGFACTHWIIQQCAFQSSGSNACVTLNGQSNNITVQDCLFFSANSTAINIAHTSTYDNAAHTIQNCMFLAGAYGIYDDRVGGITIKNCQFFARNGVYINTALTVGQTITVNNCLFSFENFGVRGTVAGEIIENYNNFWGNTVDRTNTDTGANSLAYPPLFDPRWFFELVSGSGRIISPFDLASYSQLVNVAGTSPTTTDMRGTGTVGSQREWGALEYDPTLRIATSIGVQGGQHGLFKPLV